jgi:uncharacterized protein YndB with AHSA1/START domain
MGQTHVTAAPGSPLITMWRDFHAPRELLYRAYTEPELLTAWLGPRRLTLRVDRYDLRHGGSYRLIHRDADGTEFVFRGVFHGDPSVEGITRTFEFEGHAGHVSLETATFSERDGLTTVHTVAVFTSVEDRDGMIASGMEGGVNEGYERLDELLARETATAGVR